MRTSTSTLEDLTGLETARRGRFARRTGLAVMLLVPATSFFGIYGPSERTLRTPFDDYDLSMTYGSVVRSGQAVTMEITLTHATGFDGPVRLAFEQEVFDRLDFQNWYPNPSAEIGEGSHVVYEFDRPQGNTLGISLDARVAPTQWGSWDTHAVWVEIDGQQILRTDYTVWVMP